MLRLAAPQVRSPRRSPAASRTCTCDAAIPMRRPLSIMRADAHAGWIEILYKVLGPGLHALAARKTGDTVSVLGPIGRPLHRCTRPARARCSSAAGSASRP